MRNKKICASILLTLMLVITVLIIPNSSKATEKKVELYFSRKEVRAKSEPKANMGFAIHNPQNIDGKTGTNIWKFVKHNSKDSAEFDDTINFYCVKDGVGFSLANQTFKYDESLDFVADKETIKGKTADKTLQSLVNNDDAYYGIIALADLVYVKGAANPDGTSSPNVSTNADKEKLLRAAGITPANSKLSDDMIDAIQQAAFWYFSNYENEDEAFTNCYDNYRDEIGNDWLNYKISGEQEDYKPITEGALYSEGNQETEGQQRGDQVSDLYRYLVGTAKANATKYKTGEKKSKNVITLFTNWSDALSSTQPLISIQKIREFDLALRKYITKVDNVDVSTLSGTRAPSITATEINNSGTAIYKHRKDPVTVKNGSEVTYNITVYNEGDVAGIAKEITDQLPTGLKYKDGSIDSNSKYTARYDSASNKITFTRKDESEPLQPYAGGSNLASETITFVCEVDEESSNSNETKILTNIAWISKAKNTEKDLDIAQTGDERDSLPTADHSPNKEQNDLPTYHGHDSNPGANNNETELGNSGTYFKGQEDDDDFEKLKLLPNNFDLALTKAIYEVNGKRVDERITNENVDKLKAGTLTDMENDKNDTPVKVKKGDIIKYRIRVYNEGDVAGYASKVTDDIPDGLKFIYSLKTEAEINQDTTLSPAEKEAMLWNQLYWAPDELDDGTPVAVSDYLAKGKGADLVQAGSNLLKAFDKNKNFVDTENDKNPDYRDLYIYMKVISENGRKTKIRNEAAITDSTDENGNKVEDRDSQPENWPGREPSHEYQDEEDYDIVKLQEFDLALRKFITAVSPDETIEENEKLMDEENPNKYAREPKVDTSLLNTEGDDGETVTTATYEHSKEPLVVNKNDYIVYMLRVYNEGDIAGYATKITDYLPEGLDYVDGEFNEQYGWSYDEETRTISTEYLKNELINAPTEVGGKLELDYAEVPIMCKLSDTAKNNVNQTNIAEIAEDKDYDGNDVDDRDSTPDNLVEPEETDKPKYKDEESDKPYVPGQQDDDDFEKVIILEEPDIHKGVKDVENQDSGYDADEVQKWVIESDIPENIEDYEIYKITDDIDYRLTFNGLDSVKVTIVDGDKQEIATLTKDTDYVLAYNENENGVAEKTSSGTLVVTFIDNDETNPKEATKNILDNGGNKIHLEFNTKFAKDEDGKLLANLGEQVPNQATLEYKNKLLDEKNKKTEIPEVHTGGITIYKYYNENSEKVGLEGAEFTVYASEQDSINRSNPILKATSDEDGIVKIIGLKYGGDAYSDQTNLKSDGTYSYDADNASTNYWIVETNIPEGYKGNTDPIEITINKDSYQEEIELIKDKVENQKQIFDLALRKWVTQAIVIENGKQTVTQTGHYAEQDPEPIVKVDLNRKKLNQVTVKFRYSIRITNQGDIAGYAKEITDYVPEGLKFVSQDNPGWTDEGNNVISTKLLADKLLQPGESADIEVLLTWINKEDNMGLKTNTAEISEDYNDKGEPDIDSTPDNKKPKEDDIDDAPVMLSIKTGRVQVYIVLGLSILITIAGGVVLIKKYVI